MNHEIHGKRRNTRKKQVCKIGTKVELLHAGASGLEEKYKIRSNREPGRIIRGYKTFRLDHLLSGDDRVSM